MTGEVFVSFSSGVNIPANYTSFNDTILKVDLKDSEGKKIDYNYTWKIVDFTNQGFKIQILFSDSGKVSRNVR